MHKIQTIFTTNKIKRNNYNKTWGYTNTIPITTRGSLGLNTKNQKHKERERESKKKVKMKKSKKKLKKKFMQRDTVFILHKKYSIIRVF